uniref:Uncharacterized protein n=1 Tax=Cacopsylla melanoneura TaxID=428564 RepID=A0A8D8T3T1_9HEMI
MACLFLALLLMSWTYPTKTHKYNEHWQRPLSGQGKKQIEAAMGRASMNADMSDLHRNVPEHSPHRNVPEYFLHRNVPEDFLHKNIDGITLDRIRREVSKIKEKKKRGYRPKLTDTKRKLSFFSDLFGRGKGKMSTKKSTVTNSKLSFFGKFFNEKRKMSSKKNKKSERKSKKSKVTTVQSFLGNLMSKQGGMLNNLMSKQGGILNIKRKLGVKGSQLLDKISRVPGLSKLFPQTSKTSRKNGKLSITRSKMQDKSIGPVGKSKKNSIQKRKVSTTKRRSKLQVKTIGPVAKSKISLQNRKVGAPKRTLAAKKSHFPAEKIYPAAAKPSIQIIRNLIVEKAHDKTKRLHEVSEKLHTYSRALHGYTNLLQIYTKKLHRLTKKMRDYTKQWIGGSKN